MPTKRRSRNRNNRKKNGTGTHDSRTPGELTPIASTHVRANMVNTRNNPSQSYLEAATRNNESVANVEDIVISENLGIPLVEASMVTTPNLTNDGQEAVLTVDMASIPNTNQGSTEDQVDVNNIPTSESNNIQVQVDADSVPTLNNANDDALVDANSVPARQNESRASQNVDVNVTTVESNSSSGEDSLPFNRPPDQAPTSPTGDARPTNEEGKRQEEDDAATNPTVNATSIVTGRTRSRAYRFEIRRIEERTQMLPRNQKSLHQ